jgi:hypothetical protein
MVGMAVGDDHLSEAVAIQLTLQRLEMLWLAGASIDERCHAPADQPRPVAVACVRTGVAGMDSDWLQKNTLKRA